MSITPTEDNNGSFPSAGSTFFADMTLDLHEAQMETTPRSDTKFASMASGRGVGYGPNNPNLPPPPPPHLRSPSREEIMQNVPAMPLIGEGASFDSHDDDADDDAPSSNNNAVQVNTTTTTAASSAAAAAAGGGTLSPVAESQEEERVFTRITSGGIARGGEGGASSSGSAGFDYDYTNNNNDNNNNSTLTSSLTTTTTTRHQHHHRQQAARRRNHTNTISSRSTSRPYPRDLSYTAAFSILLPIGLFLPHFYYSNHYIQHHNNECDFAVNYNHNNNLLCTPNHPSVSQMALSPSSHSVILLSTFGATILSIALLQLLYLHPGGGDGDDVRHRNVTRTLLWSANLSVWMNPMLAFVIWFWLPNARKVVVLPFALMVRDVWWRAKKTGSALPSFRRVVYGSSSRQQGQQQQQQRSRGGAGTSSSSSHDRKTFFRALACAALDILSRSLRRKSFVRVASIVYLRRVIRLYYFQRLEQRYCPLHYCNYYTSTRGGEMGMMYDIAMSHGHYYGVRI